jgi:chromate reductase, NAD(P)H dehydrogenase (quinone)
MRILGVCGSLQRQSANLTLLDAVVAAASPDVEVVLFDRLGDLPHFNPDIEVTGAPESVMRWRRALEESDAVLIASPEYGFSLPGALKNAIDWVIGSGELEGKVVAIGEPIARGPEFDRQVAELLNALITWNKGGAAGHSEADI